MRLHIYTFFAALFFCTALHGQVVINEYSAANMDGLTDNYGKHEDWVELYNAGTQLVDLSWWYLSDNIANTDKWKIPAGIFIEPGEHLLIFASDRDEYAGGFIHAGFKITQTKQEYIALFNEAQTLIDAVQLTQPNQTNHSTGRTTDGNANWGIFTNPTPGGPNAESFSAYASKPVFSHEPGFYSGNLSVSLSADPTETIYYTTDGSEPTTASALYVSPVSMNETTVLKARIFSGDGTVLPGFTEANTYFINEVHTIPVLSIAGSDLQELLDGSQFEPRGSFEYFDNGQLIDEAYGEYNKHGNDSWAYDQRGIDYITRDEMGYRSSIQHQIFPYKSRDNFQRLILKAAANDNYPFIEGAHIRDAYVHTLSQRADMELDERTYEPCIVYVNGQYWGVYEIREKTDDADYTRYYYNQGEKWIDYIKTWGGTWEEYGSRADWDVLHTYITTNDMSIPANYEYVKTQLNVLSLIDYMLINTHTVCKDWLNWNTSWWRGRNPEGEAQQWRYALWDMDATFGHYINYTGIPDVSPNADPCYAEDLPSDFEGHGALIQALMANEAFHSLYVNRYADMNNSFFTCDYMIGLLDSLIGRIQPEMPRQIDRWGGSMQQWLAHVQELKDFINTRCTVINEGIEDCYEVEGPYPVEVLIEPASSPNQVKVNTFIPAAFPYTGNYFVGTMLNFTAEPAPDWVLDHWEVLVNPFGPSVNAQTIQLGLSGTAGDQITAVFRPAIPCANAFNFTTDSTLTTISLNWEGPLNTLSYEFGYRKSGETDWETESISTNDHTLYGLDLCSSYEIRVRTLCDFGVGQYVYFTKNTACVNVTEESPDFVLECNVYPNPFQDVFSIDYVLSKKSDIEIRVTNTAGQLLQVEKKPEQLPGQHQMAFTNKSTLPAGIYIVQINTEQGITVKKLVKG